MRMKIAGGLGIILLVGLASYGSYQIIFSPSGYEEPEPVCSQECQVTETTEKFDLMRNYLRSETDGLNISRRGEKVYCPCGDTTTLRYAIFDNQSRVGSLAYTDGDVSIQTVPGTR
jgi:hypothetical protein